MRITNSAGHPPVNGPDSGSERRRAQRFPIELNVRYRAVKDPLVSGNGQSINISSAGVLFHADRTLSPRQAVEVALNWPVRLNNAVPLQLLIQGVVVRSGKDWAVVSIDRFEFRTVSSRLD